MDDELPLLPDLRRHLPPRRRNQSKTLTLRALPRQATPENLSAAATSQPFPVASKYSSSGPAAEQGISDYSIMVKTHDNAQTGDTMHPQTRCRWQIHSCPPRASAHCPRE
jgi:hypothetical protein